MAQILIESEALDSLKRMVEELQIERDEWKQLDAQHCDALMKLRKVFHETRSRVEELEKDAARWKKARKLARYTAKVNGEDCLSFDSLPWPMTCHETTADYADAAIDSMKQE